jgi:hypothetical protein
LLLAHCELRISALSIKLADGRANAETRASRKLNFP